MTTITIDATKHAREFVKALYVELDSNIDRAEKIMFLTKDKPGQTEAYERAVNVRDASWARLAAVYDALDALGFMPVGSEGVFWRVLESVTFERLRSFIREYDDAEAGVSAVFRAVLSSFGITYVTSAESDVTSAESGTAIRYTYTSEER